MPPTVPCVHHFGKPRPQQLCKIYYLGAQVARVCTIPYVDCSSGFDGDLTQTNPSFVRLATRHNYAMQSLLAFSATHLASTCKSAALDQLAFAHRGNAFRGLSEAVGSLNQENSDAVIAASAQLCWQSPGW